MFLNLHTFFILILALVSTITATKCGNYECHDNTECTFDENKKEMKCICPKDFITTFGDNNVFCCQKEDTKCGPNHQCNKELQCKDLSEEIELPINVETVECINGEQRCEDKCCASNEICHEGMTCVAKEVKNDNCPLAKQCAEKCCKENESCNSAKECIEKLSSEADMVNTEELCAVEKLCKGKCCAENEICSATEECIIEANGTCPADRQCAEKCCKENESCSSAMVCVENLSSEADMLTTKVLCAVEKQCKGKCCAENEICSATEECIIEANVTCPAEKQCAEKCCQANESCSKDMKCKIMPLKELCAAEKQCNGTCCNQEEICSENKICIDQHSICPEEKQCLGKCCSENEICTEDMECLNEMLAICSKEKRCNNKICCNRDELCWENLGCGNKTNCDDTRICLGKCCQANETCNEHFECIVQENPITLDCPLKQQQCNGKCCAENEICFESECYEVGVNDTINMPECPKQLQCGEICCDVNDICSEDFKCLKPQCLKCGEFCCKEQEICSTTLECKPNIPADANCPITQQCNGKCCATNEICLESKTCECPESQKCHGEQCCSPYETCHENVCVKKYLLNLLGLHGFLKEKVNTDLNAIVGLYDFENPNTKSTQCPEEYEPCQELCCQPHQFCNALNRCEEPVVGTSNDDVEAPQYADVIPLGYHSIGIGCLVFAVGFSLFKIICACIESQQYVLE